jgi:plastocyanin
MKMKKSIRFFSIGLLFGLTVIALSDRSSQPEAAAQAANEVTISNSKFTPKKLTVTEGTTVTWVNKEGTHNVRSDTDAFVSKNLNPGQSFSYQFTKAGTYPYYCTFHGDHGGINMAGTIVVKKK